MPLDMILATALSPKRVGPLGNLFKEIPDSKHRDCTENESLSVTGEHTALYGYFDWLKSHCIALRCA